GGVVAYAVDPLPPGARFGQGHGHVHRVRTVDLEVRRAGRGVDLGYRLGQRLTAGQPPVGFRGERDGHRHPGGTGGADDADRLADAGQGVGRDDVGAGRGQGLDLGRVVAGRLVRSWFLAGLVAVAARADHAADDHVGQVAAVTLAQLRQHADRVPVDPRQVRGGVAQSVAPVATRTPG